MSCSACGREFHYECLRYGEDGRCCCRTSSDNNDGHITGHSLKADEDITVSAGRKRAAVIYELNEEARCEWAGLANCGGGLNPIVGCIVGLQEARHHGPIKDTAHNEEGNVHRICTSCHNLWHRRNDESYDEEVYSKLPHEPRPASPSELLTRGK